MLIVITLPVLKGCIVVVESTNYSQQQQQRCRRCGHYRCTHRHYPVYSGAHRPSGYNGYKQRHGQHSGSRRYRRGGNTTVVNNYVQAAPAAPRRAARSTPMVRRQATGRSRYTTPTTRHHTKVKKQVTHRPTHRSQLRLSSSKEEERRKQWTGRQRPTPQKRKRR